LLIILIASTGLRAYEEQEYEVFYIQIDRQYVVPPTRDDILKQTSFYITSLQISCLFSALNKQVKGNDAIASDYGRFRILIRNKKSGKELIILFDKRIFFENKTYDINSRKINFILEELKAKKILQKKYP